MSAVWEIDFWGRKHRGRSSEQRDELFTPLQLGYHPYDDRALLLKKGILLAVADGMGETGSSASKYAAESISAQYEIFLDSENVSPENFLVSILQKAHEGILQKVEEDPGLDGIGTTLTMALLRDGKLYTCHVGDSRIYVINDKKIEQVTEDHSLAALVEREVNKQSSINIKRSLLYQAIGLKDISLSVGKDDTKQMKIDTRQIDLTPGDRVVLCSDGLWNVISEAEIMNAVLTSDTAAKACASLIHQTVHKDGKDNISVITLFTGTEGSIYAGEKRCMAIKVVSYNINQNSMPRKVFNSVEIAENKVSLYEDKALRGRFADEIFTSSPVKLNRNKLKFRDLPEEEKLAIEDLLNENNQKEVQSIEIPSTARSFVGWCNHASGREILQELNKKQADVNQIRKEALELIKGKGEIDDLGIILLETRYIDLSKQKSIYMKIINLARGIITRMVRRRSL